MTNPLLTLCLAFLLAGSASLSAQTAKGSAVDPVFKDLIRQYYEAWNSANTDKPAPLYARDSSLVFYDLTPLKYTGWDEYKQGVQKYFFDNMASGALTPKDDLQATRKGNIAWTTVTGHLSAKMKDGKAMETDFRHTAIWEKRGGKWLMVHEHISAPLQ